MLLSSSVRRVPGRELIAHRLGPDDARACNQDPDQNGGAFLGARILSGPVVESGDHGSLVTMHQDARGVPFLLSGAPRAHGAGADELTAALRQDLGPFELVAAAPVNRRVTRDEPQPFPEVCLPYRQANRLGYVLRNRLPILFVRTRNGELLADGRTALAYALAQPRRFADELAAVREAATTVLRPPAERAHLPADVVTNVVQPYHSFAPGFFGIPTGVYATSRPGVGLWLGPLVNREGPLPLRAGIVETDWHHREVFVVTAAPDVPGDRLLVPAGSELAQCWFVTYEQATTIAVAHQLPPPPQAVSYDTTWRDTTAELAAEGRGLSARNTGVRTVSTECVHCRISLPEAADDPDPAHAWTELYTPTYKTLRRRYRHRLPEGEETPHVR